MAQTKRKQAKPKTKRGQKKSPAMKSGQQKQPQSQGTDWQWSEKSREITERTPQPMAEGIENEDDQTW